MGKGSSLLHIPRAVCTDSLGKANCSLYVQSLLVKDSSDGCCRLRQVTWSQCAAGIAQPSAFKLDRLQGEASNTKKEEEEEEEMGQVGLAHRKVHVPSSGQALLSATGLLPCGSRTSKFSREIKRQSFLTLVCRP